MTCKVRTQDDAFLEPTQTMLNSRTVSEFPLCDQELLLGTC
ncbi:hypothetical protein ACU686_28120 [Yinghuangia aomiensis]